MKKITGILFSKQLSLMLMLILAFSAGIASFIENESGSANAKVLVYNAPWFELLLLVLMVNLAGILISKRLLRRKKYAVFLFHAAFILILAGGAITRYTGNKGTMHLHEGQASNIYYSDEAFLSVKIAGDDKKIIRQSVLFTDGCRKSPDIIFYHAQDKFRIETTGFLKNAILSAEGQKPNKDLNTKLDAVSLKIKSLKEQNDIIVYGKRGRTGDFIKTNIADISISVAYGSLPRKLPFSIRLNDFVIDRYPGSSSPSNYLSDITLADQERDKVFDYRIFMNHILRYRGYRFYQSGFDSDEQGSILMVSHDMAGTLVTYSGFALMLAGMLLALFSRNTRLRAVLKKISSSGLSKIALILLAMAQAWGISYSGIAAETTRNIGGQLIHIPDKTQAAAFGNLVVLSPGDRLEPLNSLSNKILRKLCGKGTFAGMNADQVFLGVISETQKWQHIPLIKIRNSRLKKLLGAKSSFCSYSDFFDSHNNYRLSGLIEKAFRKAASTRNSYDRALIAADEKMNVFYLMSTGSYLRIYPKPGDGGQTWLSPESNISGLSPADSLFIKKSILLFSSALCETQNSSNYSTAMQILEGIALYQKKYAAKVLPSRQKRNAEILYNKLEIFELLYKLYGLAALLCIVLLISRGFSPGIRATALYKVFTVCFLFLFIFHSLGLALRWYISGHVPLSNGYETMLFVSWGSMLAGILFSLRLAMAPAVTAFFSSLSLFVAHLSWMNPEVTNLIPVLQSVWLTIHVAVITASYSLLGLGMMLGLFNMLLMLFRNSNNAPRLSALIRGSTSAVEASLIIGLYLLAAGTILGAVWANESWGRYWGWDPKETWALVTILVYAAIVHLKFIQEQNSEFLFNALAVIAFGCVIMTWFGVNYYLSGLHAYTDGKAVGNPHFLYLVIALLTVLFSAASFSKRRLKSKRQIKKKNHIRGKEEIV